MLLVYSDFFFESDDIQITVTLFSWCFNQEISLSWCQNHQDFVLNVRSLMLNIIKLNCYKDIKGRLHLRLPIPLRRIF